MNLTDQGIANRAEWEKKGFTLPEYNRAEVFATTKKSPSWVHFGAGNIFRAFQAELVQELLNEKKWDKGLIVAEGYDDEIIDAMYLPHDNLSILVTLKAEGSVTKTVVGSIVEALKADSSHADFDRLREIFREDSLQMASFTITEKGYKLCNAGNELMPEVLADMEAGPGRPVSYIGKIAALVYERFCAGAKKIAMVSMDNCSHNGEKLYAAVHAFAKAWCSNQTVPEAFLCYVENPEQVSFPWSMIDKITPRPDDQVKELLAKDGVAELDNVVTKKNTYVAPFVNAEECQYLVIEDAFPNGRPPLDQAGVIFTTREKVEQVERMKVCTCLNPLHTALAVYGCLLGYTSISAEMKNPVLVKLAERIGYVEGMPVVTDPGIIRPVDFLNEVVQKRIPNVFMPDTPQRIASDTSQKLSIRFGETIAAYRRSGRSTDELVMIPLVFAGWLRYLMAVDDEGAAFTLSPDPLLETVCHYVTGFCKLVQHTEAQNAEVQNAEAQSTEAQHTEVQSTEVQKAEVWQSEICDATEMKQHADELRKQIHTQLRELLSREDIFGVNLYEDSLGERVEGYFAELLQGRGAIRRTLEKYTAGENGLYKAEAEEA